ncbi:MAG: hypothetical protein MJ087_01305 [Lachnospiraceae bacterium]|nr:hypothetical protein [Lachnospiraceae bacterium]
MKKILLGLAFIFALCAGFMVKPSDVAAATKVGTNMWAMNIDFEHDIDTYSVDLDKDGKKDKIEAVMLSDSIVTDVDEDGEEVYGKEYQGYMLKISGKTLKTWMLDDHKYGEVYIMKMADGKYYLSITTTKYSNKGSTFTGGIYKYKSGALTKLYTYETMISTTYLNGGKFGDVYGDSYSTFTEIYPTKVSKDNVYYNGLIGTKALGNVRVDGLKVKYSKGTFSTSTSAATASVRTISNEKTGETTLNSYAKSAIKVKKSVGSTKTKFTIKKGAKFKVTNLYIKKKVLWVKVKAGSKTGYVKLGTSQLVKKLGQVFWG